MCQCESCKEDIPIGAMVHEVPTGKTHTILCERCYRRRFDATKEE